MARDLFAEFGIDVDQSAEAKNKPRDLFAEFGIDVGLSPETADSAIDRSFDQAQKMFGRGVQSVGGALDSDIIRDWGAEYVKKQDMEMVEGRYKPEYEGSLMDQEGILDKGGWIVEKMAENAAYSGFALAGGFAAAIAAPFSASAALAMGGGVIAGSGLMGAGEAALEMEEAGVPVNDSLALGVGAIIGILDRWGAASAVGLKNITKLTGNQVVQKLIAKGHVGAAKELATEIAKRSGIEVGTELAQEGAIVGAANIQGAEYTTEDLINRVIDTAAVSAGFGGAAAVPGSVSDVYKAKGIVESDASPLGGQPGDLYNVTLPEYEGQEWAYTGPSEQAPDTMYRMRGPDNVEQDIGIDLLRRIEVAEDVDEVADIGLSDANDVRTIDDLVVEYADEAPPAEPALPPAEPALPPAEPALAPAEPALAPAEPAVAPAEPTAEQNTMRIAMAKALAKAATRRNREAPTVGQVVPAQGAPSSAVVSDPTPTIDTVIAPSGKQTISQKAAARRSKADVPDVGSPDAQGAAGVGPPKTVIVRAEIPSNDLSTGDLVERIKAQSPGGTTGELYSTFVKARNLKPEIDAKTFGKMLKKAVPDKHVKTQSVGFVPTHKQKSTGRLVQITERPDGTKELLFDDGGTGGIGLDKYLPDGNKFADQFEETPSAQKIRSDKGQVRKPGRQVKAVQDQGGKDIQRQPEAGTAETAQPKPQPKKITRSAANKAVKAAWAKGEEPTAEVATAASVKPKPLNKIQFPTEVYEDQVVEYPTADKMLKTADARIENLRKLITCLR